MNKGIQMVKVCWQLDRNYDFYELFEILKSSITDSMGFT